MKIDMNSNKPDARIALTDGLRIDSPFAKAALARKSATARSAARAVVQPEDVDQTVPIETSALDAGVPAATETNTSDPTATSSLDPVLAIEPAAIGAQGPLLAQAGTGTATSGSGTGAAAGTGVAGASTGTLAVIGGVVGVGAAVGGGGGGKSSGDTPAAAANPEPVAAATAPGSGTTSGTVTQAASAPTPPPAPTIDSVTSDNRIVASELNGPVTITGGAIAGAVLIVSWGTVSKAVTADASGRWTASFDPLEVPRDQGARDITATVTLNGLASSTTRSVLIDTLPQTPVIQTVADDDRIDAVELALAPGIAVTGTGMAGAAITVAWGSASKQTSISGSGQWSVTFKADEVPTAQGSDTISAYATHAALNSATAKHTVTIDTIPLAPTIDAVSTDNRINALEFAAAITVSGSGQAGSSVSIDWAGSNKSAVVGSDGLWSASFSGADLGSTQGASSLSATITSSKLTSDATTRSVQIDTIAPTAPSVSVNGAGVVSGTAEANAKVTIDTNGDTVADATTTAGADGSFTFGSAYTSGQQLTLATIDAAGNSSSTVSKFAPNLNYGSGADNVMAGGTGADVLMGGAGADELNGGGGSDQIFGGSAGSIRNYQFEYWDLSGTKAGSLWYDGKATGNVAFINDSNGLDVDMIGWNTGSWTTIASRTFGQGANATTQWIGQPDDPATPSIDEHNPPVVELRAPGANDWYDVNVTDSAGIGGRFLLDTVFVPSQGGAYIYQTLATNPNSTYTLNMRVSDPSVSNNSIVVTWKGAELAVYDAIENTWSGTAPTVTPSGTNYVELSWTVTGNPGSGSTPLDIKVYGTPENNVDTWQSLRIERVTLDDVSADGNDLLIGGAGADILYGQAGNDTLYGGSFDSGTQAATADATGDAFVYTMRTTNGNDVIKDFEVGVDKLVLIDLVDSHLGSGTWDAATNPDASRAPYPSVQTGPDTFTQADGTVNLSDYNLSYHDLVQATSPNQYLEIASDGTPADNVVLTLYGHNGAARGSIVLEGVQYGAGAGQYDSVEELMGDGYMAPNVTGSSSAQQILWLTTDGYNPTLMLA